MISVRLLRRLAAVVAVAAIAVVASACSAGEPPATKRPRTLPGKRVAAQTASCSEAPVP